MTNIDTELTSLINEHKDLMVTVAIKAMNGDYDELVLNDVGKANYIKEVMVENYARARGAIDLALRLGMKENRDILDLENRLFFTVNEITRLCYNLKIGKTKNAEYIAKTLRKL